MLQVIKYEMAEWHGRKNIKFEFKNSGSNPDFYVELDKAFICTFTKS